MNFNVIAWSDPDPVDGQQRIRSIYDIYHAVDEDSAEDHILYQSSQDDSEVPQKHRVWCLNLTRTQELEKLLEPHAKEYSLFVFTTDPQYADTRSPLRYNVVPLLPMLRDKDESLELFKSYLKPKSIASKSQLNEGFKKLLNRVKEIQSREFFVTVKEPNEDQAEIVNLYNRINVGGKKVESEERAFARLVAINKDTWSHITSIFELIHEDEKNHKEDSQIWGLDRDQVLRRQKEKLFGFKLFIRTFIQVCNYHFNQPIGSSSFSFGLVERRMFRDRLRKSDPIKVQELWQITKDVIQRVRAILKDGLYCDDLVFLPETFCLVPLFQFLIQYPGLRELKYQKLLGWYALLLLLSELTTREILGLASRIQRGSGVAFHELPDMINELDKRVREMLRKKKVLDEADSIQNRYVLLLYWLLRKNKSIDFSYRNLDTEKQRVLVPGEELKLEESVHPERQHIVPFSRLKNKLEDADAQRGTSHRFNNIGNFTYISRILNHYETGLSNDFIDLQYDTKNALLAHFLWTDDITKPIQEAYEGIKKAFEKDSKISKEGAGKLYDDFCRKRRNLIAVGFEQWLEELRKVSLEQMGIVELEALKGSDLSEPRLEADVPKFVEVKELKPRQRIRLFDYDDLVEDYLVKLAIDLPKKRFTIDDHSMKMNLTEKRHIWLELNEDKVIIKFDSRITDELKRDVLSTLNMGLNEDHVYLKASGVQPEIVMSLHKAMERIQQLKTKIDLSIKENKDRISGPSGEGFWEAVRTKMDAEALEKMRNLIRELEETGIQLDPIQSGIALRFPDPKGSNTRFRFLRITKEGRAILGRIKQQLEKEGYDGEIGLRYMRRIAEWLGNDAKVNSEKGQLEGIDSDHMFPVRVLSESHREEYIELVKTTLDNIRIEAKKNK